MPNVNFIFYKIDIARNHLMINENNSAEKYIKEVKQLATEPPLIHLVQIFCAELYVLLKKTKETEECLNEGSKLIGQYGLSVFEHEFNRVSGMLHELNNDFDNAIIKYEESIHESPPWYPWGRGNRRSIGRCYRKLKKYKEAENNLLSELKVHPFHPKTHYELGLLYADLEDIKKAKNHMNISIDIWKDADPEFLLPIEARKKLKQYK